MKKRKQRANMDKNEGVFNVGGSFCAEIPDRRSQETEGNEETGSSFALREMFLSLENEGENSSMNEGEEGVPVVLKDSSLMKYGKNVKKIEINEESSIYNGKRIQEFSIPKSLERQKQPRLYLSDKEIMPIGNDKSNIKGSDIIMDKIMERKYCNGASEACCDISDEIVVCNDFSFNKKSGKSGLLSGVKERNWIEINGSSQESEERENVFRSKISKNKFFNELSDLEYHDDDDGGIFYFDDSSSASSFKESNGINNRRRSSTEGSEAEKTYSILVKDKNSQVNHDSSKTQISYSNDEDIFWSGDLQDENSYIPLFRKQTYEEYNSSDDLWSFCTSLFSETNDTSDIKEVNSVSDKPFFENNFDISNEKGYTTDEDQNFIIKKKNQTKVEISDNNFGKGHSHFTETNNHASESHNFKTSTSNKKENFNIETVSTNSSSNSRTTTCNTQNKPPILGTWTRDLKRPIGIIDGTSTNVINPVTSSCTILSSTSNLSPSSIPSLDDILDTSAFVQLSSSDSSSSITKNYLSDFYRWDKIPIGTFRRHQQRFMNTRDELIKGEWFVLTNKSRRQRSNVPILGTTVRHKKNKLKKTRHKNKLKTNIELFEEDQEVGMEHCGLGLGPQLSPLFNGLS
ncbi:hypothetical protein T552_01925 [Pneumocystis carinii B80]|uniref:Uncharacterized protein n=1 Tax=Pneumocystis carinii (strain B80) TaxID=1408658 RepID=A0A0W4ZI56_PNEC8|nr:hypothetical protein T552_01925 [Pneumocystis carinii B80]KTW28063.1 hypothetical protein T552_01925 [Pneumocystis carinii B80]